MTALLDRHEVLWRQLAQAGPLVGGGLARLALATTEPDLAAQCDSYCLASNQYFFSRPARGFHSVLNFYRTGRLHLQGNPRLSHFLDALASQVPAWSQ